MDGEQELDARRESILPGRLSTASDMDMTMCQGSFSFFKYDKLCRRGGGCEPDTAQTCKITKNAKDGDTGGA